MSKPLYLVAVDGSEWSCRAAERAVHLAEKTNARVTFLTVISWPYIQPVTLEGMAPPVLDKGEEEKYNEEKILAPLMEQYGALDLDLNTQMLWGEPVDVIRNQVKEQHANMLFVGRHGRSPLVDVILGSVSNKLAHSVWIPIVLVP